MEKWQKAKLRGESGYMCHRGRLGHGSLPRENRSRYPVSQRMEDKAGNDLSFPFGEKRRGPIRIFIVSARSVIN